MIDINTIVDAMTNKIQEHRPPSLETAIGLICLCFSGYLQVLPKHKPIQFKILEEHIKCCVNNADVIAAYKLLSESAISDQILTEVLEIIPTNEMSISDWKNMLECLVQTAFLPLLQDAVETPNALNQLCMSILHPCEGSFYDGTAGIGSTAIAATRFAERNHHFLKIYTQEKNTIYHAISILRAFMFGIDCSAMLCGDTLTEPKFITNENRLEAFDYSVMFPPLGISWKYCKKEIEYDRYKRFPFGFPPTSSADWLFIQHQFASLKPTGKGIIVVPSGALFNAAVSRLREQAIQKGIIDCIISLPPNMLPYTNIPLNLVILNGKDKAVSSVLFIQAEGLFSLNKSVRWKERVQLDDSIIDQITQIYKERKEITGISKIETLSKENDFILLPSRYVHASIIETDFGKIRIENQSNNQWPPLATIGDFYCGVNVSTSLKASDSGTYKVINYSDVQDGKLSLESLGTYNLAKDIKVERNMVRPGDILVSCKGAALKICVVPNNIPPILLSINFIGIHIDQTRYDPRFIKAYLESPVGQSYLQQKQVGTSIFTLATRDLEKIPFPGIPLSEQKRYIEELLLTEETIQEKVSALYTQSRQAKWDFYLKIGLGKIMKKENDNGRES